MKKDLFEVSKNSIIQIRKMKESTTFETAVTSGADLAINRWFEGPELGPSRWVEAATFCRNLIR